MMKTILRFLAGLAILSIGVFVMKGLIGMKEPPPRHATSNVQEHCQDDGRPLGYAGADSTN